MAFSLNLLRKEGIVPMGRAPLLRTPTKVSHSILPSWEEEGLEPTLAKYLEWVKKNDTFVVEPHQLTLALNGVTIQAPAVERNSPAKEHTETLLRALFSLEVQFPKAKWVWTIS